MFEGAGEREKGIGKGFIQPSVLLARNLGYMYQECATFLVHNPRILATNIHFTMDTLTRQNNNRAAPACTCPCSQLVSGLVTNKTKGSRIETWHFYLFACLAVV